jgi:hypothetical protein
MPAQISASGPYARTSHEVVQQRHAEMDGIAPGFQRLTKPFRSAELAASLAKLMPTRAV